MLLRLAPLGHFALKCFCFRHLKHWSGSIPQLGHHSLFFLSGEMNYAFSRPQGMGMGYVSLPASCYISISIKTSRWPPFSATDHGFACNILLQIIQHRMVLLIKERLLRCRFSSRPTSLWRRNGITTASPLLLRNCLFCAFAHTPLMIPEEGKVL